MRVLNFTLVKFDQVDVLVESVARGVFDSSDVDEELYCFIVGKLVAAHGYRQKRENKLEIKK